MNAPKGLRYTSEHEWIRAEGSSAVVGISDFAQTKLGDITYIEPGKSGRQVKKGDCVASVESVKAVSDVYAPVSGRISAVNARLSGEPELVNRAPYGDGWICRLDGIDAAALETLMDEEKYMAFLAREQG